MTPDRSAASSRPAAIAGAHVPSIAALVEREARRFRALLAAGGASVAVGVAALLLALGAVLFADGRWITLPAALPALLWLLAVLAAAGVAALTWRTLAARGSRSAVAGVIERERALRTGALRGALEVAESGALGRRAADDLARRLAAGGPVLAPALRRTARRRAGGLGAAAAVLVAVLVASTASFADGWAAVGHPLSAWRGTLLPRIVVEAPGEVLRGERATVRVQAPGRREVTLRWRVTGAGWTSETHAVRDGRVDVPVGPVRATVTFVATDGRATSDTAVLHATDRPFVGDVALRAVYPDYLKRPPEPLASGEVARLPRGTMIVIAGRASSALQRIGLARGRDTIALRPDGHRFEGKLGAFSSGTWSWPALGAAGPIADVPPPIELDVVPDSAPRVDIASPTRDTVVDPGGRVAIALVASDDHGLGAVSLRSWRQSEEGRVSGEVTERLASGAGPQWSGTASLDVASRGLEPGDALHVVATASDQSPWSQGAESRELVLRVPSLSEQRAMARRTADSAVAVATALASAEKSLQQRTSEAARARDRASAGGKGGERGGSERSGAESGGRSGQQGQSAQSQLSFQRAEQAKSLSQEQRALADRVKELQQAAKTLERQLAQAGALDSGLAARLAEAQRMLQEALTPELQEQLEKLEQAAQGLQGEEARQALGDLAQQQQRLREQLERSAEMLKRAALEGAMQTLRDEARELAQRQRELADSLGPRERPGTSGDSARRDESAAEREAREKADAREDADREKAESEKGEASRDESRDGPERSSGDKDQRRAQELAQRSRDLSRDVAELEKRLREERAETGAERADAAQQHAQASAEALQKAGRQAGARDGESGKESARKAAGEMDEAAQQLAEAREKQVAEWKQELTKELDQSIQEMLQLSRSEEQLAEQTARGQTGDAQGQQSSIQQGVEKAGQRLQKAGQKSSLLSPRSQRAVSEARQKVQQATQETAQAAQDAAQQGSQSGQQRGQQQQGPRSGQEQPGGQQSAGQEPGSQPGSEPSAPPQSAAQLQAQAQAMREAAEALNRAAASLVRDRERANAAKSASGLPEMIQEMNELAQQQGSLNQQAAGLSMMPGGKRGSQAQAGARTLGQKQRGLAQSLEGLSENDESGRAEALAREAQQIAQALERGAMDQSVLDRQQRLYRRLLEAGKTLEQDERDDTGKREARSATGTELFTPGTDKAAGKAAARFREPSWAELRGLSAEERRLVLEYFKRLNAQP